MRRRNRSTERQLATVLFTDIVGSTELAAELGDRRWNDLLATHHTFVRRELKRFGGREVDTAGDGFFATFEQPARAVSCACAVADGLHQLGIDVRAGVHMGEVEIIGPKVGGIAVHIGARVMSQASAGEILVSGTVRDLMAGSEVRFDDRGVHELKGVPGEWRLYAVERDSSVHAEDGDGPRSGGVATPPGTSPPGAAQPAEGVGVRIGARAIVAIAIVVLLLGATAGYLLFGRGASATFTVRPNSVVRIDPHGNAVAGGAEVGTTPIAVADGEGVVWVGNFDDRTVQRVNPNTDDAGPALGLTLNGNPDGIATGGGFVWVASSISGQVFRIDPHTNAAIPIDVGVGVSRVAFGEGAVWASNADTDEVVRIDPQSSQVSRVSLPAGSSPKGLALGGGAVWVAESLHGRVARIDPATMKVTQEIPLLKGQPQEVAFGAGAVWVTDTSDDSVVRIQLSTNQSITIAGVGNGPAGVAADSQGVWVANTLDGTVARIDPATAKVSVRVRLGFSPEGVAVGQGGVWVTVHSL